MPTSEWNDLATRIAALPPNSFARSRLVDLAIILDRLDKGLEGLGRQPATKSPALSTDFWFGLRYINLDEQRALGIAHIMEQHLTAWLDGQDHEVSSVLDGSESLSGLIIQARRDLGIWRLRAQPTGMPIDFERLMDSVLQEPRTRAEVSSVNRTVSLLVGELRTHRDDLMAEARTSIDQLTQALKTLEELTERVVLTPDGPALSEEPSISDPRIPIGGLIDGSGGQSGPDAASGSFASRRAAQESTVLLEAAEAEQTVRALIERDVAVILGQYAIGLRGTKLQLATTEGLAQVIDDKLEIQTDACKQLADLLQWMKGGSVGLSGHRGVGKSTILRRFYDGRESIGNRPLLSVLVSAPVVYDSRDFMLFLFAELCIRAGAVAPPEEPISATDPNQDNARHSLFPVVTLVGTLLGSWIVLAGLGSLIMAMVSQVNHPIVWGSVIVGGCGLSMLLLYAFAQTRYSVVALLAGPVIAALGGIFLLVCGLTHTTVSIVAERSVAVLVGGLFFLLALRVGRDYLRRYTSALDTG